MKKKNLQLKICNKHAACHCETFIGDALTGVHR